MVLARWLDAGTNRAVCSFQPTTGPWAKWILKQVQDDGSGTAVGPFARQLSYTPPICQTAATALFDIVADPIAPIGRSRGSSHRVT